MGRFRMATARGADLFIAECCNYDRDTPYHMSWRAIEANLHRLTARRVMLTHMGAAMLASRRTILDPRVLLADDGLAVDI